MKANTRSADVGRRSGPDWPVFLSGRYCALAVTALAMMVATSAIRASSIPAPGRSRTETIVRTGDAAPDGNGVYSRFFSPSLNSSGQAAFLAFLSDTSDNRGIFRSSGTDITQIVRSGHTAPDGSGVFSNFISFFSLVSPALNESGETAFWAALTGTSGGTRDDTGIFRGSDTGVTQIVREGQAAPDANGVFTFFDTPPFLDGPALNASGQTAFTARVSGTSGNTSGFFRGNGTEITQIARWGQAAPDGNGVFSSFFSTALNNSGQTAFSALLIDTSDDRGIFRGNGTEVAQVARTGQPAPDGNGVFSTFFSTALNNSGELTFFARLAGTSENEGIFLDRGIGVAQLIRTGQTAPDGNGVFSRFGDHVLNDSGQVAFSAFLNGTSGGGSEGIFRGSEGAITQIARRGEPLPDGNSVFSSFFSPALNDSGQAAFVAGFTGPHGGRNDRGIFAGDGIDLLQVVRKGELIDGVPVSTVALAATSDDRSGLNQYGQIAFQATLTNRDEVIRLWTPDLHWRSTGSGSWDDNSGWTLSLPPAHVHDVFIDPPGSLTVIGPAADTIVRSLQIGGGSGQATLSLGHGVDLIASQGVTIESTGILSGQGTVVADVTSRGMLSPGDSAGVLTIDGNLTLDGSSSVSIELGGREPGQFDQLIVTGDLHVAGTLFVDLIDGHTLGFNLSYLIGDVGDSLFGRFNGLDEGDLVGTFGGRDLFITYAAGDGSSIALFTAVPEPSGSLLVMTIGLAGLLRGRCRWLPKLYVGD